MAVGQVITSTLGTSRLNLPVRAKFEILSNRLCLSLSPSLPRTASRLSPRSYPTLIWSPSFTSDFTKNSNSITQGWLV